MAGMESQVEGEEAVRPLEPRGARLGARTTIDPAAIARAEAALAALSGRFTGWMADEAARLEAARSRVRADPGSSKAWAAVHLAAHDLKGLGATYGYPLATRICASLCRLLDDAAARTSTPPALLDAHVDAVQAVVRDDVRDPADPAAVDRCCRLKALVADHLAR